MMVITSRPDRLPEAFSPTCTLHLLATTSGSRHTAGIYSIGAFAVPTSPFPFQHALATEIRDYPEWHRGRQRYGLWMIPIECPQLLAHIERLKHELADLFHPSQRQPHITLFVCGFEQPRALYDDDFTPAQLQQQLADLQLLASAPCTLQIGAPTSFATAAYLPVGDPAGHLRRWRVALGRASSEIRQSAYVPHVTLGLYRREISSADLHKRLQALAGPSMSLPVPALEYVTYLQNEQFSHLDCLHRISVGSA
jgi:2'-5' RNA ligase